LDQAVADHLSLRTLQHLDLLDINQFLVGSLLRACEMPRVVSEGVADVLHLDQRHIRHHRDEIARVQKRTESAY
jgi:hypothetical protein